MDDSSDLFLHHWLWARSWSQLHPCKSRVTPSICTSGMTSELDILTDALAIQLKLHFSDTHGLVMNVVSLASKRPRVLKKPD